MTTVQKLARLAETFPALSEENKQYILGIVDALAYVSSQQTPPGEQAGADTGKAAG